MIIDKEIKLNSHTRYKSYYEEKGYKSVNGFFIVKIEDLSPGSHALVNCLCDVCSGITTIMYYLYMDNISTHNLYTCSHKCSNVKRILTCNKVYGVDNTFQNEDIKNKIKDTMIKNHGVEHPMYSIEIKNKMENTNIERYGVKCTLSDKEIRKNIEETNIIKYGFKSPLECDVVKEKIKDTMLVKYNVEHPVHSIEIKNKMENTNMERYGVKNTLQKKEFVESKRLKYIDKYKYLGVVDISGRTYYVKCDNGCDHIFETDNKTLIVRNNNSNTLCTICNPVSKHNSDKQKQIYKFISDNFDGNIINNDIKQISPKEIDIFIENKRLAIEFNGLYWHSELLKNNNYHFDKFDECYNKNINMITIWEDDWKKYKNNIHKSIINIFNNVLISDYTIKYNLNTDIIKKFIKNNSLYSYIDSDFNICLFDNNILISVITYNKGYFISINNICNNVNKYYKDSFNILINKLKNDFNLNIHMIIERNWNYINIFKDIGFIVKNIINQEVIKLFKYKKKLYKIYNTGFYYLILK